MNVRVLMTSESAALAEAGAPVPRFLTVHELCGEHEEWERRHYRGIGPIMSAPAGSGEANCGAVKRPLPFATQAWYAERSVLCTSGKVINWTIL